MKDTNFCIYFLKAIINKTRHSYLISNGFDKYNFGIKWCNCILLVLESFTLWLYKSRWIIVTVACGWRIQQEIK